jgi:O-antigen/teichoic acid export membrane protein
VSLLASGGETGSISRLLHSPRLHRLLERARDDFDMVLVDAPPILNLADARILGRLSDGVILVVRAGQTGRETAQAAIHRFMEDGTTVLGAILNDWNPAKDSAYGYAYGYSGYSRLAADAPREQGGVARQQTASLRFNFTWTFAGNMVYAACQWGALIVLAKLTSPEVVGQYALGLAIAAPAVMFANLQLRWVLTTDVKTRYPFGAYLSFRILTTAAAMAIVAGVALALHYNWRTALVVLLVGAAQSIEAISDIFYGQLQLYDHMDRIAISMMVRGPLSLAAMGVTVWTTGNLAWGVVALALARAAILLGYDMRGRTHRPKDGEPYSCAPNWQGRMHLSLLATSFPLGVVAGLVTLNSNIPRYFIEGSMSSRALGIFSALAFLQSCGNLVVQALGQSVFVRLAAFYAAGRLADFYRLVWRLLSIDLVLGVGGLAVAVAAGARILTVLYRPEYGRESAVLVWVMGAAALGYLGQSLGCAVTAARYFASQIPLFATVAASAALASYLLVPRYGLKGAALALGVSALVQAGGTAWILAIAMRRAPQPVGGGAA